MEKYASMLSFLDKDVEHNIYVANDFSLDIFGNGNIPYRYGIIVDVYHVPNLSANMMSDSQLTQTSKIVEFWP